MEIKKVSYNLSASEFAYIEKAALQNNMSRTDYIKTLLANDMQGKYDGKKLSSEDVDVLRSIGIGSISGFAGYQIAKFIRTKYTENDNQGIEILLGLVAGLGGMLLDFKAQSKKG
jgi:hypothetical protein